MYALTNEKGRTRAERAGVKYYEGIRAVPYAPMVKLADRMATPTWYHPALAALVFILVAGYGFERLFLIALVLYSAGLVALVTAYRRITGVWSANLSRIGARRYVAAFAVVLIVQV